MAGRVGSDILQHVGGIRNHHQLFELPIQKSNVSSASMFAEKYTTNPHPINYSSYLRKKDDVVLSGLTAGSMNEFFEVCLGGLITLPAAFIFLGVAAGGMGTFGLGFNALPNVFAVMPAGRFFGFLWFFMLFMAAITSSLSMLQPVIAFLEEGFGLKRHASATFLGLRPNPSCARRTTSS